MQSHEHARLEAVHVLRRHCRDQSVAPGVINTEALNLDPHACGEPPPGLPVRYRGACRSRREHVCNTLVAGNQGHPPFLERRRGSCRVVNGRQVNFARCLVGQTDGVGREGAQLANDFGHLRRRQQVDAVRHNTRAEPDGKSIPIRTSVKHVPAGRQQQCQARNVGQEFAGPDRRPAPVRDDRSG